MDYILEQINDYTYKLEIKGEYANELCKSIKILLKSCHIDYETNTLIFSAENVTSFKTYLFNKKNTILSYGECINLIDNLSKQIYYLHKTGFGFYGFNITDILTIDNIFIICSTQFLLPIHKDYIIFVSPIMKPYFSNPELFKLTSLPSKINYKCCYYSLGLLVVFSLLHIYLLVGNELKTTEEIDSIIEPIFNTKIYWFIKRCLSEDINNRQLLLV